MLPAERVAAVRANIFPEARHAIRDWERFRWHNTGRGCSYTDADSPSSSQAACISLWGTVASPAAIEVRRCIGRMLASDAALQRAIADDVPSVEFEVEARAQLNEFGAPNATRLDAMVRSAEVAVIIESKIREAFGSCSQAPNGKRPSSGSCSGVYGPGSDLKGGTDAACRLAAPEGRRTARRYWDVLDRLCVADAWRVGEACAFAGALYQVMRTVTAAAALAESERVDWRVVFSYSDYVREDAAATIGRMRSMLKVQHRHRLIEVTQESIARELFDSADPLAKRLGIDLRRRLNWRHSQQNFDPFR